MSTKKGWRERLPLTPQNEQGFRWRGEHVTRVEGFMDAVFAFAVTLLVVALEVPKDYEGLLDVVRYLPTFVICFTLLMTFWNAHYRFHRRYGIEDNIIRVLTMAVIVLVLFFVYPLKFLFALITVNLFALKIHDPPHLEALEQLKMLYVVYGLGFAGIWGLYGLMYVHAWRKRTLLELDEAERLYTKGSMIDHVIFVGVCAVSILLALFTDTIALPGWIYFALGPLLAMNGMYFGRKIKALTKAAR